MTNFRLWLMKLYDESYFSFFFFLIILLNSWTKIYDLEKLSSERGVSNCQRCPALPKPHAIQQSFHRTLKGYEYIPDLLKVFYPL